MVLWLFWFLKLTYFCSLNVRQFDISFTRWHHQTESAVLHSRHATNYKAFLWCWKWRQSSVAGTDNSWNDCELKLDCSDLEVYIFSAICQTAPQYDTAIFFSLDWVSCGAHQACEKQTLMPFFDAEYKNKVLQLGLSTLKVMVDYISLFSFKSSIFDR